MDKWTFHKELKELCVKCTELKPSTAERKARDLFNKYDGKIISEFNFDKSLSELSTSKTNLIRSLNCLKLGFIKSDNCIVYLKNVVKVDFKKDVIVVHTKNSGQVDYDSNDFAYLKNVFKYSDNFYDY
jgi:hypothetical protein